MHVSLHCRLIAVVVRRVGRTGRAGRRGTAVTFFVEEDAPRLQAIADCMRRAGCAVPEWMLLLQRGRSKRAAEAISSSSEYDRKQREHRKRLIAQSKVRLRQRVPSGCTWCLWSCVRLCGGSVGVLRHSGLTGRGACGGTPESSLELARVRGCGPRLLPVPALCRGACLLMLREGICGTSL